MAYLRGLGINRGQLARLTERCPELFSWPVEERAEVLFGQLMGLGLSAAEAGRCFEMEPPAAACPSFAPAIGVLAGLLASGSLDGQPHEAGRQLLAGLLRKQPAATRLLEYRGPYLQAGIDDLLELGMTEMQLAARVQTVPQFLALPLGAPGGAARHLAQLEAVLLQELGCDRALFLKLLLHVPRTDWQDYADRCLAATMLDRPLALAEVCGCARKHPSIVPDCTAPHRTALRSTAQRNVDVWCASC